ncbi:hypothetical protein M378DRAFT_13761 [Amanita muscaria Koide BX008]|uniref:Uncharacterized protein n=1 Tax=Amanita muscaria (strain Koide BX008) TaxID=946122 RepID=A0A0C2WWA4_AMAMK|nr:hypothetical protein M378DRAFT_13761 [Amanita muscaria Koide BX008]
MSTALVNITLDGQHAGSFSHDPDLTTQDLIYNAPIFSQSNLANAPHELVIATNDYPISTFINFDWAIYSGHTHPSQSTSSSTSSTTTATTNSLSTSRTSSSTPTNSTSSTTLNGHTPASQSTSSSISSTGFPSTTNSSSTVSTPSPTPTPQNSSSKIGIIVGGTLGGLAVIILVLLFLVRRSRRAPPVRYENTEGMLGVGVLPRPLNPQTPIPDHLNQTKAARIREAEIGERIRSAQREMDTLNSQSASQVGSSLAAGSPRPTSELGLLRSELRQLRDQIGTLQAERGPDLALGLSDEVPPAYSRH